MSWRLSACFRISPFSCMISTFGVHCCFCWVWIAVIILYVMVIVTRQFSLFMNIFTGDMCGINIMLCVFNRVEFAK